MENKRIAVLPIVETPENWEGEIHAGYALEYAPEAMSQFIRWKISYPQEIRSIFFRSKNPGKGHREKTTYEVLCELANEAVSRGYEIEVAFRDKLKEWHK